MPHADNGDLGRGRRRRPGHRPEIRAPNPSGSSSPNDTAASAVCQWTRYCAGDPAADVGSPPTIVSLTAGVSTQPRHHGTSACADRLGAAARRLAAELLTAADTTAAGMTTSANTGGRLRVRLPQTRRPAQSETNQERPSLQAATPTRSRWRSAPSVEAFLAAPCKQAARGSPPPSPTPPPLWRRDIDDYSSQPGRRSIVGDDPATQDGASAPPAPASTRRRHRRTPPDWLGKQQHLSLRGPQNLLQHVAAVWGHDRCATIADSLL